MSTQDHDYCLALAMQDQFDAEQAPSRGVNNTEQDSDDPDYQLALQLQAEEEGDVMSPQARNLLDDSLQFAYPETPPKRTPKRMRTTQPLSGIQANYHDYLNQTQNLVHPEWELVDPTPDIFAMFGRFNDKFFQKRLGAVTLEWSKRMTSCAGICYSRGNSLLKVVTIRLSEPLLKLRPRKDLVQTLLHEMIHAFFFVLNVREGNGGHGPNFKRMMNMINKVAGTNITVYHSFHEEVALYRTHIWRCTGICQNHAPFQGYVKRTANRAPGPNDQWWEKHQRECGGTFMKIGQPDVSLPEKPRRAKKATTETGNPSSDIRNWLDKPPPITASSSGRPDQTSAADFRGAGADMGGVIDLTEKPRNLRERWLRRLEGQLRGDVPSLTRDQLNNDDENKKQKKSKNKDKTKIKDKTKKKGKKRKRQTDDWEFLSPDVMVHVPKIPMVDLTDESDDDETRPVVRKVKVEKEEATPNGNTNSNANTNSIFIPKPVKVEIHMPLPKMSNLERTMLIKSEVLEDEYMYTDDEIILIDDEYHDDEEEHGGDNDASLTAATELADQSILDDLFGEDTLLQEFERENDLMPSCSNTIANDIVSCPICMEKMKRSQFADHLDGCSITIRVEPPSFKPKPQGSSTAGTRKPFAKVPPRPKRQAKTDTEILRSAGYTTEEINALNLSSSSGSGSGSNDENNELTPRQLRQRNLFKRTVGCPRCGREFAGHQLEAHRLLCWKRK
ncbi:hypothetical protein KR009_009209 [Drosophila setifemur]|nr:hypothetical protein KR009_009209 [Drosophila setifemur]